MPKLNKTVKTIAAVVAVPLLMLGACGTGAALNAGEPLPAERIEVPVPGPTVTTTAPAPSAASTDDSACKLAAQAGFTLSREWHTQSTNQQFIVDAWDVVLQPGFEPDDMNQILTEVARGKDLVKTQQTKIDEAQKAFDDAYTACEGK